MTKPKPKLAAVPDPDPAAPDTKPKRPRAQTGPSKDTKAALTTEYAGPITVNAHDLFVAYHNAGQARQRTKKGSPSAQCIHIEWFEDRLQLIGLHDALMLRSVVEAAAKYVPDRWAADTPYRTTLMMPDKVFESLLLAASAKEKAELTLTVRVASNRDQQLEGHEWEHELLVVASDGQQVVVPLADHEPLPWRSFEPYATLGIDASSGSVMPVALHNRLGALRGVAQLHSMFIGPKRPLRLEGTYKDAVVLRGYVMPTAIDVTDVAGVDAGVLVSRLSPSEPEPADTSGAVHEAQATIDDPEDDFGTGTDIE